MYIYPQWTFKKNFEVDLFTGHIVKITDNNKWDARAYITDVFDYSSGSSDLVNTGIKVYHNTNEGEVTDYAVGITGEDYPNNITMPNQLAFGFHFHDNSLDIIHNGSIAFHIAEALNTAYFMEIEDDQTLRVFYEDEDRNPIEILDCSTVLDNDIYHVILLAATAKYTDLKIQIDQDGVKAKHILDVQYTLDETNFISLYEQPYDVPIIANKIRVSTNSNIRELSLNKDSIKVYRYLPSEENPDLNKELVYYDVPDQWGTNDYFDIIIHEFLSGYVYQVVIGTKNNKLISYTKWRHIIDNLETDYYTNMDNLEFVNMLYDVILERQSFQPPSQSALDYWVGNLDNEVFTREYVVIRFAECPEYAAKQPPKSPPEYEIPFELQTCVFEVEGEIPKVDEVTLNQFFNDIYFKARNLDTLIDIDKIVHEISEIFDYEYSATEFNAETKDYFKVIDPEKEEKGLKNVDQMMEFENSKIIEKLFVSEYLPEYTKYMKDLNDPDLVIINASEAENLKELLFKNITLMNYFKGNRTQMQFLISIFSSSIGYYYVSVDADPYHNFVYRVSTTLPKKYWIDDIKDITHPLGWDDFYVYIPKDALNWHQMKLLSPEDFEEFWEMHSKLAPISYVDIADYLDENGDVFRYGTYVGNAMLYDLTSPKEFPFGETQYNVRVDYQNSDKSTATDGLFYNLRSEIRTVEVDIAIPEPRIVGGQKPLFNLTQYGNEFELEFLRSGIAAQYKWRIYRGETYLGSIQTYIPKFKYIGDPNSVYNIVLDLKFDNQLQMSICNYVLDGRHSKFKTALLKGYIDTFINQSVNNKYDTNGAMLVGDSGSEKEYKFTESNYNAEMDFTKIHSIIPNINIIKDGTKYEIVLNEGSTENLIYGLFNEYQWIISDSGEKIYEVTTPSNSIIINEIGLLVEVFLIRNGQRFNGPNPITTT